MKHIQPVLVAAMMLLAVSPPVWSQEKAPVQPRHGGKRMTVDTTVSDQSTAVMDRVIIELVAWRTGAAEQILASAKTKYEGRPSYETASGLLRFNQDKAPEALGLLSTAATLDPKDPAIAYFQGEVLTAQGKHDAASDAWRTARDLAKAKTSANAKDARAQYYLGAARVRLKDAAGARTALNAARQNGLDSRMVDYQLGLADMLDKDWNAAKTAFDAVIEKDSRFAPAYFYRGIVWSKLGRNDKMADDLEEFLLLAPSSPEADTANVLLSGYQG